MKPMYYISYGSNMNLTQMAWRCPNTKVVGNGKAYGYKLTFNYHADIIKDSKTSFVPVVVWKITDEKDLAMLDRYEGYPNYYVKKNITVVMDSGEKIRGMVYVMAAERRGIFPPSAEYLKTIIEGYEDNGINNKPLYEAVKYCMNRNNITEHNQYNPRGGWCYDED